MAFWGPHGQQEERSASLLAGRTTIGTAAKDIVLQGPGLAPEHCYIENARGTLTLHPCGNACAIDGVKIQRPTRLTQGRAVPRRWVWAAPGQELAPVGQGLCHQMLEVSLEPSCHCSSCCSSSWLGLCRGAGTIWEVFLPKMNVIL